MSNYNRLTSLYNRGEEWPLVLNPAGETPRETANRDQTALSAAMDLIDAVIADFARDSVLDMARLWVDRECRILCDEIQHHPKCKGDRRLVAAAVVALQALTDEPVGE